MKTADMLKLSKDEKIKIIKDFSVKIYDKYLKVTGDVEISEWLKMKDLEELEKPEIADWVIDAILLSKSTLYHKRKINPELLRMQYDTEIEETAKYLKWKADLDRERRGIVEEEPEIYGDFEFSDPF